MMIGVMSTDSDQSGWCRCTACLVGQHTEHTAVRHLIAELDVRKAEATAPTQALGAELEESDRGVVALYSDGNAPAPDTAGWATPPPAEPHAPCDPLLKTLGGRRPGNIVVFATAHSLP